MDVPGGDGVRRYGGPVSEPSSAQELERSRSHPGWFGGIMGTSALAIAAFRLPSEPGVLQSVSTAAGWVLLSLAVLGLAVLVLVNLLHHTPRRILWQDLRSRERGPAYAAVPGAVLTVVLALEAAVPTVADEAWAGWTLLIVALVVSSADVVLTLVFFASAIANRSAIEEDALTGVWFMPQTVLLLSATTLARLSAIPHGSISEIAAPIAVLLLGAGFMLFAFVGALVLGRLVSEPVDPAVGVPAAWIMMSPAAAAALAFMALPQVIPTLLEAPPAFVSFVTSLAAGALVGFSLWWVLVVGVLTIRLRHSVKSFSPASWSFVFPLAAVAVASGELAHVWDSSVMVGVAIGMAVLATIVWVVICGKSLKWLRARLTPGPAVGR